MTNKTKSRTGDKTVSAAVAHTACPPNARYQSSVPADHRKSEDWKRDLSLSIRGASDHGKKQPISGLSSDWISIEICMMEGGGEERITQWTRNCTQLFPCTQPISGGKCADCETMG